MTTDTRPNVLLVTVDHWPGKLLGCAGHRAILTPTLDELARHGTRFTRAYSESPACVPARRSLMTGTSPRTHGDRAFADQMPMPDPSKTPTLAQCFRNVGYQATAVGKLHVYPQRNRIGFDEVILDEEGRGQYGVVDDYSIFLAEQGHAGKQFSHGMGNNEYLTRPWHLPERLHATNWAAEQMSRQIQRKDPTRPAFWYLSFRHPHPPLVPLQCYLDLYDDIEIPPAYYGDWCGDRRDAAGHVRAARRAFYALCTHIDHQLRIVLGTLRENNLIDNTIICFTSDHGDMLGDHGMWRKQLFQENAANIPMILADARPGLGKPRGAVDDRLVALRDVMPTLLDAAGIDVPSSVEGLSMTGAKRRDVLYGETREGHVAQRMIHDGRFKLIYAPAGNRSLLFDLETDPDELRDLSTVPEHQERLKRLRNLLIAELYGDDCDWLRDGKLAGLDAPPPGHKPRLHLNGQRGLHYPQPTLRRDQ